ncbi:DEAD/DEAH box helicase [Actinoalloteichus hoggarensis]|uniref:ATP-dependent helicase HepA n=1 Tax=Actinoalloteichus hoggarensis TaxID=1470176 RepID=A0A221W3X7_9PSEU|nr:DEAD/DEAH box helicase [Actinoalloteichus hoggarensis]ASO20525.1 ATP-dependent helicase HepA [Actinoalloteichus hoggarensis]
MPAAAPTTPTPSPHPVAFVAADPPRAGRLVVRRDTTPTPHTTPDEIPWVRLDADGGVHVRPVLADSIPVGDALTLLADPALLTHPTAVFWRAARRLALHLVARGRLLPGLSPTDVDAWRIGPWDAADIEHLTALAEAMPPDAHAVPLTTGGDDTVLAEPRRLLRDFLDAVADTMPRGPAAADAAGTRLFAAAEPRRAPELRDWARQVAAGADTGVRISLRLDTDRPATDWAAVGPGSFRIVVQLHSLADATRVVDAAACWAPTGPPPAGFGGRTRVDTVLAIRRAAPHWAPLGRLLTQTVPAETDVTDDEVFDLLDSAARRLAAAGVDVHLPRALGRDLTTRLVAGGGSTLPDDTAAYFDGTRPLRLDWQVALGGNPLTDTERDLLADAHRPVVRLRDQWVLVDPDVIDRARRPRAPDLPAADALRLALTGHTVVDATDVEVVAADALETLRTRIADPRVDADPIDAPAALAGTLRDYQLTGLRWLNRMTSLGLGCCLADDMGLGKTITVIALHLHRRSRHPENGPTLVVCPASLLGNWEREITRFAPGTPVRRLHGGTRTVDDVTDGIVLTTYATMRLHTAALTGRPWGLLVADEAQHVKNHRSHTATALRRIPARARVALTGTPVENSLTELWAILDWTTPGLLGTQAAFRRATAALHRTPPSAASGTEPPESSNTTQPDPAADGRDQARRLTRLVRPFLLRRHKSDPDIAPELPPKTETDHPAALTTEQAGLYEAVIRETLHRIADADAHHRRGLILTLLTSLKQICNHPAHYLRETRPRLRGRSGKLAVLDEIIDTATAGDGAVLVFTQYVAMARLLRDHLTRRGVTTRLLHGGTPVDRREEHIRRFQDGEVPVFLLSLKAAGTGLNLTRADHVVHYDRWWNPAVEDQATDRAHRIGQIRPVQVHRLIAEGTLEDRIAAMLAAKRDLADAVLTRGEQAFTELSDADLAALIELRNP